MDGLNEIPTGAGAAAPHPQARVPFPHLAPLRARLGALRRQLTWRGAAGLLALSAIASTTALVVLIATSGPTVLVPHSSLTFPDWVVGPLRGVLAPLTARPVHIADAFSVMIGAMAIAYCVALVAVPALNARVVIVTVVALNVLLLLSPPLQLTDFYNYIGYARLGALHGLDPYTHVLAQAGHDPVYKFTTWHHLHSPYGPLFTAVSYPLAFLPLPAAYWVAKIATVLASLAFLALVWDCARRLGRDPRFVLVFVALNPIFLIYALGGFHNDFFMLVPSMGAIALLLARRDKAAGAALAVAIAVKFTAGLLLPFLLLATPSARRRLSLLGGLALAGVPLLLLSIAMFGPVLPNLATQESLLTNYSIPNLIGDAIGAGGGAPWLLHLGSAAVAVTVVWMLIRNRDWVSGAGWAMLVLVATLGWLLPWYVIWVLPLAALGSSRWLRYWTLVMTAFLVLTFVPWTTVYLRQHGVYTLRGSAGKASWDRQRLLEW